MVDGQAELHSSQPLRALADAVDGAAATVNSELDESEAELAPRLRRLARAQRAVAELVWAAERALSEAEGDEARSAAREWLDRAEDVQRELSAAIDDVQHALGRYRAAAQQLSGARRREFPAAAAFLRQTAEAAEIYSAIDVPAHSLAARSGEGCRASALDLPQDDLASVPLPLAMTWVPTDRIAPESLVAFETEPPKGVARDVMERGTRSFYERLVPLLRLNPAISREALSDIDRRDGTAWTVDGVHPESLANLYDVFVAGSDRVAAEARASGDFVLSSGRHRATLARELGYTHVPAKLLGRSGR